jgi:hypothetical protein
MVSVGAFQAETDGATADWLLFSAGIMLLGMFAVYEVFVGSTNQLVSEMNGGSMTEAVTIPTAGGYGEVPAGEEECDALAAFNEEERCTDQMGG